MLHGKPIKKSFGSFTFVRLDDEKWNRNTWEENYFYKSKMRKKYIFKRHKNVKKTFKKIKTFKNKKIDKRRSCYVAVLKRELWHFYVY